MFIMYKRNGDEFLKIKKWNQIYVCEAHQITK